MEKLKKIKKTQEKAKQNKSKLKKYKPDLNHVNVLTDERYKYTFYYYLKPFLLVVLGLIGYFLAFRMWDYWRIFIEFSVSKLIILFLYIIACGVCFPSVARFAKLFYYIAKVNEHLKKIKLGRITTVEGEPNTGKTTTIHYDGYHLAYFLWHDMQVLYYKLLNKYRQNNYAFKTQEERWRWHDFRKSFLFFKRNEKTAIPLLYENTPVREKAEFGGRYSYVLEKDHFTQKMRLGESAVLIEDESADDLGHDISRTKKAEGEQSDKKMINEFMSKERHFINAYMYFAEQDASENFIGLRRVTTNNIYLTQLEKVLEPERYLKRIERIDKLILRTSGKVAQRLYNKARELEECAKKIGFLKLKYQTRGNITKSKKIKEENFFVMPKNQPIEFETRSFFFDYKARKQPLACKVWDNLYKSKYEETKRRKRVKRFKKQNKTA